MLVKELKAELDRVPDYEPVWLMIGDTMGRLTKVLVQCSKPKGVGNQPQVGRVVLKHTSGQSG